MLVSSDFLILPLTLVRLFYTSPTTSEVKKCVCFVQYLSCL